MLSVTGVENWSKKWLITAWNKIDVVPYILHHFQLFDVTGTSSSDITSSYWKCFLPIWQGRIHTKRPQPTFNASLRIWTSGKIPRRSTLTSLAPLTPKTCNLSLTQWPTSSSRTTWRTADSSRNWLVSGEDQLPQCHVCQAGYAVCAYVQNNQCSYCGWSHILALEPSWNKTLQDECVFKGDVCRCFNV